MSTATSSPAAAESPAAKLNKMAESLGAIARPLIKAITFLLPIMISMTGKAYKIYKTLPHNVVKFWVGFIFCFFGGLYPVTFAAIQAAEHGGRKKVAEALTDLSDEAIKILEASKKDDKEDLDKDGKADVEEIDGKALMMRKVQLVLTKMDPEKVDKAIASMYRVWLSVVAVLTLQFARVITLSLSISDFFFTPYDKYIVPVINKVMPQQYQKWTPVVGGWVIKFFAMSLAWYIQSIISAFTSALSGGLMMSRAAYDFIVARGWTLGGMIAKNHEESVIDEIMSYLFAAGGFLFQFWIGFDMPFPFNLLLWPLELTEFYIRWTITKKA
uniref:Uncharacterized protein n=1 Tax=Grammatophora oceanica TaxID=210454 RepID=A0A6U5PYM3_9STRA